MLTTLSYSIGVQPVSNTYCIGGHYTAGRLVVVSYTGDDGAVGRLTTVAGGDTIDTLNQVEGTRSISGLSSFLQSIISWIKRMV